MALWIEIHCDVRSEGPADWGKKNLHPFCYTNSNENPSASVNNSRQGMMDGLFSLEAKATRNGWKKNQRTSTWACPNCQTMLKPETGETKPNEG